MAATSISDSSQNQAVHLSNNQTVHLVINIFNGPAATPDVSYVKACQGSQVKDPDARAPDADVPKGSDSTPDVSDVLRAADSGATDAPKASDATPDIPDVSDVKAPDVSDVKASDASDVTALAGTDVKAPDSKGRGFQRCSCCGQAGRKITTCSCRHHDGKPGIHRCLKLEGRGPTVPNLKKILIG